jgi:hypothetical protein
MRKRTSGIGAVAILALLGGCSMIVQPPNDEELTLRLLRDYEAAVYTGDAQAAMDCFSDTYEGFRGSGKEGVGRMVERMTERGSTIELDLTETVVTVEDDTARLTPVRSAWGDREMTSIYVLVRTPEGWKIDDIEWQR